MLSEVFLYRTDSANELFHLSADTFFKAYPCFQEDLTMVLGSFEHCFMHKQIDPRGITKSGPAPPSLLSREERLVLGCSSLVKLGTMAIYKVRTPKRGKKIA